MSTDTIKNFDDQGDLKLVCPACIEAATIVKGEKEVLSKSCFRKYSFDQLEIHLNGKRHSREQLVEVAMRAAAFFYCHAFEKIEGV
jgi:hypothetical protein